MTAAEYREANRVTMAMWPEGNQARTLAALEERERLLAERLGPPDHCYWCKQPTFGVDMAAHSRQCDKHPLSADAAVGALVRHLVETTGAQWNPAYIVKVGTGISYPLTREGLQSALDSLLPKEPEVVVKLGGRTWTFGTSPVGNTNVWWRPGDGTATVVASGELELALNALNALGGARGK